MDSNKKWMETEKHSARVSNGDPNQSKKKAKFRNDKAIIDYEMVASETEAPYKEKLLTMSEEQTAQWESDFNPLDEEELTKVARDGQIREANQEEPQEYNPCPEIYLSNEELKGWDAYLNNPLIVNVLGKQVSFKLLEAKLRGDQEKTRKIHIIGIPRNFYVVQFISQEDYKHALYEGPWLVGNHYILVQRWRPFFSQCK